MTVPPRRQPPLSPGAVIGVLGGGQLGRMLGEAASRLGFDLVVLDPEPASPAARVAARQITAAYDDADALDELGRISDVVTFEFENVPAASAARLAAGGALVAPGPRALAIAQDRVEEKTFLNAAGAATVDFRPVHSPDDLRRALVELGAPALLKTRREGYDGKGQAWVRSADDVEAAWAAVGGRPSILEARADFRRELSIIAARGWDGSVAIYPLGENRHADGILRTTHAPATADAATAAAAQDIAARVLNGLDYVGVVGIELFDLGDQLLVNEIAPRVHNTGHWTQDGCACDQFEQHIRAIVGWPLGPTAPHVAVEMTNLLGADVDAWPALAAAPDARLHLYGKAKARPGRKMGHVNRLRPLSAGAAQD